MIPVTDAYPALLRLTLRCLTCHGGVGVLLGCIFFLFFFPFFQGCYKLIYKYRLFFFFLLFFFFPLFFFFFFLGVFNRCC